jgi:hypothetical protein
VLFIPIVVALLRVFNSRLNNNNSNVAPATAVVPAA